LSFAGATSGAKREDWPEGAWSGIAEGVAASGRGPEGVARGRAAAAAGVALGAARDNCA